MRKNLIYAVLPALVFQAGCNSILTGGNSNPKIPVWIDAAASVGANNRDIDQAWAMIQAFHSIELQVVGVSAIFGNSPMNQTYHTAGEITGRFGPSRLTVYAGASGPTDLGRETEASKALSQALIYQRLTILALGPATDVATVLKLHPEVQGNIVEIVAVAGRRPGQRFTIGQTNPKPRQDTNFELDPDAFALILYATKVPLTLAPFELSSKVWIDGDDIQRLPQGRDAARYLFAPSRQWLAVWQKAFNVQGFNPFATLAVGYLTSPSLFQCEDLPAQIVLSPDDTIGQIPGATAPKKAYLWISQKFAGARTVHYCFDSAPGFKVGLMRRIMGGPNVQVFETPNPPED